MKLIIASDSFKGSLTSLEVAHHITVGFGRIDDQLETHCFPIADGGEGTVAAVIASTHAKAVEVDTVDPLGHPLKGCYALLDEKTAVIEVADASGIQFKEKGSIMCRSSRGTGLCIRDALDRGCREILVGLGGSATNDGGLGILDALGYDFYDADGHRVRAIPQNLKKIVRIDATNHDHRISECTIRLLCDVTNPLTGPQGASHVFGEQKGAQYGERMWLDAALEHFSRVLVDAGYRDVVTMPGSGAAGGIGFALASITDVTFESGIDVLLDLAHFDDALNGCDLVITGEGRMDGQSINGKAPIGVAKRAHRHKVPTVAIVGCTGEAVEAVYDHCIQSFESCITYPQSVDEALTHAAHNVEQAAERLARMLYLGKSL